MSPVYEFGPYRLDPSQHRVMDGNKQVPLTPKAFQTLLVLVESQGRVVEKEELLQKVWPDAFVEEATLAQNVFTLRKQLHDDRGEALYIETVPKRGYRFVASVRVVAASNPQPAAAPADGSAPTSRAPGLAWIAIGAAILLVAAFFGWRFFHPVATGHIPMIAVLPVDNLTGDPNREFLTDGLTEELIAQLGALDPGRLGVIARTSSMTYKGSGKNIPQIAQELGVDYLLESSLREDGDKVRVTAQLIRARGQTHLWAKSYDRELKDMLRVQTEIAGAVAAAIELSLSDTTRTRLAHANTVNPDAYQAYLKGRYYWNTRTRDGLFKSVDFYNQALQLDPASAHAYAGLADAYNLIAFYGFAQTRDVIEEGTVAARKALELDPNLPDAHASLAYANFFWWWHWQAAEQDFRRALELDDNYLPAHQWYALYLAAMGRQPESLLQIGRARALDPLSPAARAGAAYVNYFARRYDDALRDCDAALAINSKFMVALYVRGLAREAEGDFDKAISDFQSAVDISSGAPTYAAALGHAYAMSGKRLQATAVLAQLRTPAGTKQTFFDQAIVSAGLGMDQEVIGLLKSGDQADDTNMIWLRVDPRLDRVRSDPWVQSWLAQHSADKRP